MTDLEHKWVENTLNLYIERACLLLDVCPKGVHELVGINKQNFYKQQSTQNMVMFNSNAGIPIFAGGFYDWTKDKIWFDFDSILTLLNQNNLLEVKRAVLHEVRHCYQKSQVDTLNAQGKVNHPANEIQQWESDHINRATIPYIQRSYEIEACNYVQANVNKI